MDKRILVLLAEGCEEMEVVIPSDLAVRAGLDVVMAGIEGIDITGSHGISLIADCEIVDIADEIFDAVIIPGGMPGAENIANNEVAMEVIQRHADKDKLICAICAAPGVVLGDTRILDDRMVTCYPGFEKHFNRTVTYIEDKVAVSGNVITAKGPGVAFLFGREILKALLGEVVADKVLQGTFYSC